MTNATSRRSSRLPGAARTLERALLGIGACCLVVYGAACAQGSWFQSSERAAFERAIADRIQLEAHDESTWSKARREGYREVAAAPVEALSRLEVPDAGVSVMVLAGTDEMTLNRAVGHIEGTSQPGQPGNVGIAGHRDSFFRGLRHLEVGDAVALSTLDGVAQYQVESLEVVEPTAVEVLAQTDYDALTLVTCYPFYFVGDAPQRFIVHARKVRFESWGQRASLDGSVTP